MKIDRLKKLPLRQIWANEAYDFTTWLAEPANLELLSEEIGLDLVHKQTEASVGRYSLDILAEENDTGRVVIIENQLENTDHDHLGKVVTYASGLDAEIMIWIAKDIREEHQQAVNWLNQHTDDHLSFFLIQIEAWQIGDVEIAAPNFNIICQPNNWSKALKEQRSSENMTDLKITKLDFWTGFKEHAEAQKTSLRVTHKPTSRHYYVFSIGRSDYHLTAITHFAKDIVNFEFYIKDNEELFAKLKEQKEDIEADLGMRLVWEDRSGKASRIRTESNLALNDTAKWSEAYDWFLATGEKFLEVFPRYI